MSKVEQTLSIIKPDAVKRNLVEQIKEIFIRNNLIIKKTKKLYYQKKKKQLNFTRYINLNLSTIDYAPIFLPDR